MKKTTISVAIATLNEEANIKRCLNSVTTWVDEIIIFDEKSSDNTPSIAKTFPKVKLFSVDHQEIFHVSKQKAIDACHSDWILQLDADEVVTPKLRDEIIDTIGNTKFNGFWINRKNFFLGKFLTKGGVYPDATLRLYRRGLGKLPCIDVHEQAKISGPVSTLNSDLLHYADPTFDRFLFRNNRYTSISASQLFKKGQSISFLNYFIFKPFITFFSIFFRHRGYVDGFQGFVFAYYSALRFPSIYVKLFEMKLKK